MSLLESLPTNNDEKVIFPGQHSAGREASGDLHLPIHKNTSKTLSGNRPYRRCHGGTLTIFLSVLSAPWYMACTE
ncbi:MAG: hypothetical protein ABW007_00990 [Chitinophagaceae bacterium]